MVDFQERDTRRDGRDSAAEESDDGEEDPEDATAPGGSGHGHDDGEGHSRGHGGDHHDHGDQHQHDDHHHHDIETLGAAVVTVSSTRTVDDDPSGNVLCEAIHDGGHEVVTRELLADDLDGVQRTVDALTERDDVDAVVTTGGTGVTPDDVTIEAVRPLFHKELPGFGELFRRRSEEEIGTRTIATRATAGIVDGVPVFCLPGSENAARQGIELVLAEAGHVAGLARRDEE